MALGVIDIQQCAVSLVRIYGSRGREMDSDNLAGSMKAVRDGIADALGIDDGDTNRVRWSYSQKRGKWYAVHVTIDVEVTE